MAEPTKHMLFSDEGMIAVSSAPQQDEVTLRFRVPITSLRVPRAVLKDWSTLVAEAPVPSTCVEAMVKELSDITRKICPYSECVFTCVHPTSHVCPNNHDR